MIYQGAVHPFCSLPVVAKAADGLVETQDQHTLNLEQYLAQSMEKVLTAQALRKGALGEQRNGGCQHRCLEEPGQPPRCACHPGFVLAPDMASCLPEDACHLNPCQGTCRAHAGGFECSCEDGYTLAPDGRRCVDVDECLAEPCQHECQNTAGSFVCLCQPGYRPAGPSGRRCHDEDECAQPGVCPQLCLNVPGSFHCACRSGYQRQPGGDACLDVDECLRDPCPGPCRNLPGSFECLCPPGSVPQDDGRGCHPRAHHSTARGVPQRHPEHHGHPPHHEHPPHHGRPTDHGHPPNHAHPHGGDTVSPHSSWFGSRPRAQR
ncbi:hypothetical protein Q9233_011578 [Columba guinea]|nr:hypothetical protein Q9233_011578 [Columba guinea]